MLVCCSRVGDLEFFFGGDLVFLFVGARDVNFKFLGNDSIAVGDRLFGLLFRCLVRPLPAGRFQYVLSWASLISFDEDIFVDWFWPLCMHYSL